MVRDYYPAGHPHAGLLAAVTPALDAERRRGRDSLVYDAAGNLARTISPTGILTLHYRDALGRDTLSITPIHTDSATTEARVRASGVRQRTTYDVMDRVRRTESIGPPRTYAAVNAGFAPAPTDQERLEVITAYDPEGLPETIVRTATPDYDEGAGFSTEFTYDAAGRKRTETSSQTGYQTFTPDHAGNVVVARTAAGRDVFMQYDALGRLTRRTVPERTYAQTCDEIILVLGGCETFPRFPNFGTGYKVPEEWHHYRYDAAGDQVFAENGDARVQRTYFPGGAVQTDSTWIRADADGAYSAYGLRYTYDVAGRVTALEHPRNLTGNSVRADSFAYHPVTGSLSRATSRLGHAFDFYEAPNGQLTSLRQPGAIVDSMRYDLEGRLVWRNESGPAAGVLHAETMVYDARGKLLQAATGDAQFANWYSGLGTLVGNDWFNLTQNVGRIAEELRTDPLGSTTLRRTNVGMESGGEFARFQNVYEPSTGRLIVARREPPAIPGSDFMQDSTIRRYDAGGNVTRGYQRVGQVSSTYGGVVISREVESRSYYGSDDRLRVFQKMDVRRTEYSNHEDAGVWEEYRYDPLGRRVLVHTRTDGGLCNYDAWGCTPSTTTFVWAGDQLLWELKSASGTYSSTAGGNVGYFHAGGIDRPLVITKGSTSIVPHQNWRGQFARGTYADGAKVGQRSDCTSYPASGCVPIQWPGERTTARHELEPEGQIRNWFGGLVDDMRDASGQMYRRNRYYDPQTGQFTQPDPIGLAGGLNAYGFAAGDPVSYSDPYGLSATCRVGTLESPCRSRDEAAKKAMQSNYRESVRSDTEIGGEIVEVGAGQYMYTVRQGSTSNFDVDPSVQGYAGYWHTHGAPNRMYDSERFSGGSPSGDCCDLLLADVTHQPAYVITPRGRMLRYDPDPQLLANGPVTEIGRIPPPGRAPPGSVQSEVQRLREAGAMYRVY